jgi:uncharacterized cupin superfamily protein
MMMDTTPRHGEVGSAAPVARVIHLDQLDAVPVAGVTWRPVRRALGITAFGTNAYSAGPGELLIEPHDELGGSAHEELYVIVRGHATFTVDGAEIDAPAGTLVFVAEPGAHRTAVACDEDTIALAVGGEPVLPG